MDQYHMIQSLWKRSLLNSGWRKLFCAMLFSKEVDYLIWVYEKKLKFLKGPHGKSHKVFETVIEKLNSLKDLGEGDNYSYFPLPINKSGLAVIKKYQERMGAEYTLDYSIWQYQLLAAQKKKIKDTFTGANVYADPEYLQVVSNINRCKNRLKEWRIKLMKLDQDTYVGTDIVDRDILYAIDQDGYNREVLGIYPQNNDDLFGVSHSPSKSSKKSPKKGKKGK